MEAPVATPEDQVARLETLLRGVDDDLRALRAETAALKARVAALPATWVMLVIMLGGQLALAGILVAASLLLFTAD